MGTIHEFRCDRCGHRVVTSGPWEFYRDADGQRKPVGHPRPISPEAVQAGIHGLDAVCYCSRCRKTIRAVVREYDRPLDPCWEWEPGKVREKIGFRDIRPSCPGCGNGDLVLEPVEGRSLPCPECGEGKLAYKGGLLA